MKALIILILFSSACFAQTETKLKFFYPNGNPITFKVNTIKELLDSLHEEDYDYYDAKSAVIGFKKFTQIPLFIMGNGKLQAQQIKQAIAGYSSKYSQYMASYSYYYDLKDLAKQKKLTDEYLRKTLGEPSYTVEKLGYDSSRVYFKYNCTLDYNAGNVDNIEVLNYREAFTKYKLLIDEFIVTGEDYTIGFDITITNLEDRKIKYLYITVLAKNPVDDFVAKKTVTAVGPINFAAKGTYNFDNIIFSKTAESLSIESIRVLYFDGTQRVLSKLAVKAILHKDYSKIE